MYSQVLTILLITINNVKYITTLNCFQIIKLGKRLKQV